MASLTTQSASASTKRVASADMFCLGLIAVMLLVGALVEVTARTHFDPQHAFDAETQFVGP